MRILSSCVPLAAAILAASAGSQRTSTATFMELGMRRPVRMP